MGHIRRRCRGGGSRRGGCGCRRERRPARLSAKPASTRTPPEAVRQGAARKLATNDALWHARGRFRTFRALRVRRIPRSPESRGPPARRIGPPECHRASFVANFPKALVKTGIDTSSCSSDIQAEPPLIGRLGGPCTRRAEPSEAPRDPARAAGRAGPRRRRFNGQRKSHGQNRPRSTWPRPKSARFGAFAKGRAGRPRVAPGGRLAFLTILVRGCGSGAVLSRGAPPAGPAPTPTESAPSARQAQPRPHTCSA